MIVDVKTITKRGPMFSFDNQTTGGFILQLELLIKVDRRCDVVHSLCHCVYGLEYTVYIDNVIHSLRHCIYGLAYTVYVEDVVILYVIACMA